MISPLMIDGRMQRSSGRRLAVKLCWRLHMLVSSADMKHAPAGWLASAQLTLTPRQVQPASDPGQQPQHNIGHNMCRDTVLCAAVHKLTLHRVPPASDPWAPCRQRRLPPAGGGAAQPPHQTWGRSRSGRAVSARRLQTGNVQNNRGKRHFRVLDRQLPALALGLRLRTHKFTAPALAIAQQPQSPSNCRCS